MSSGQHHRRPAVWTVTWPLVVAFVSSTAGSLVLDPYGAHDWRSVAGSIGWYALGVWLVALGVDRAVERHEKGSEQARGDLGEVPPAGVSWLGEWRHVSGAVAERYLTVRYVPGGGPFFVGGWLASDWFVGHEVEWARPLGDLYDLIDRMELSGELVPDFSGDTMAVRRKIGLPEWPTSWPADEARPVSGGPLDGPPGAGDGGYDPDSTQQIPVALRPIGVPVFRA